MKPFLNLPTPSHQMVSFSFCYTLSLRCHTSMTALKSGILDYLLSSLPFEGKEDFLSLYPSAKDRAWDMQ